MKRRNLLAVLFAVALAALLALLFIPRGNPDDLTNRWARVAALRLPDVSLSDITEALGPPDANTAYSWYQFLPNTTDSPMSLTGWHMLEVTVDSAGHIIQFQRRRPFVLENGTIYPVDVDQGYRDEQGRWQSGSRPTPTDGPW
jgi:hypothetical protein